MGIVETTMLGIGLIGMAMTLMAGKQIKETMDRTKIKKLKGWGRVKIIHDDGKISIHTVQFKRAFSIKWGQEKRTYLIKPEFVYYEEQLPTLFYYVHSTIPIDMQMRKRDLKIGQDSKYISDAIEMAKRGAKNDQGNEQMIFYAILGIGLIALINVFFAYSSTDIATRMFDYIVARG